MNYLNYITVLTPDNIEVNYRLAGLGSRMAAAIVDLLIQLLVLVITLAIFFTYQVKVYSYEYLYKIQDFVWASLIIGSFVFLFGYYIVSEIFMRGQTPGKRLFKLRVIRENGQPAGFVHILIRSVLKFFVDPFGVGVILIWFSQKSKRLGDMAASTIVVAENSKRISNESLSLNSIIREAETVKAPIQNKLSVTKDEYDVLKDYFGRKNGLLDSGKALGTEISSYFAKKFGVPAEKVTEEVLFELMKLNRSNYTEN